MAGQYTLTPVGDDGLPFTPTSNADVDAAKRFAALLPSGPSDPYGQFKEQQNYWRQVGDRASTDIGGKLGGLWSMFSAPADALRGNLTPDDPRFAESAIGLAAMGVGGGMPAAEASTAALSAGPKIMARKAPIMYDPPVRPPRPFEADYPAGALSDAAGNLTHDIDGRPLTAPYVAGRRVVGGPDVGLSSQDMVAGATQATGRFPEAVPKGQIGGDAGRYVVERDRRSGDIVNQGIQIDRSLDAKSASRVLGHEFGHAVDELSGSIPTAGLDGQLRQVYNDLNNPQSYGKRFGPEQNGYKGQDVQRELTAEAVRAYLSNPNYLKTAAPDTAAAIRSAANANPAVNRTIQFNTGPQDGRSAARGFALTPVNDAGRLMQAERATPQTATPQITAYHGSPHDFDEFSMNAIGSGEGAQAYGHGLYFAENEGVAKQYRDAVTGTTGPNNVAARMAAGGQSPSLIEERLKQIYPDITDAEVASAFDFAKNKPGHMYQVGINAHPDHFLDFDAPITDQHPIVQKAVADLHPWLRDHPNVNDAKGLHVSPNNAEEALAYANAGVPGIKYFDQMSRGAGEGSRNYVVFDDKTIDILKKYGIAGLGMGGAGIASMFSGAPDAQAAPRYKLTPISHP